MREKMENEYELRILCETKLTQTIKQLRKVQAEIESLESDIKKLIRAMEEMKCEQRYFQEMMKKGEIGLFKELIGG
jgi:peptidoglycan hydrolase CwlO-like protein